MTEPGAGRDEPQAHGPPPLVATLKARPEDFVVEEVLGFAPSGEGEHAFLTVEKRGANTEWVARRLASHAGVVPMAVGFAGMKDRHAVTRQHFTVQLPRGAAPDWSALGEAEFRVLAATRHSRKLKRGGLTGNRFEIVLRDVRGDVAAAHERLDAIERRGVPNYYGEQRFGRAGGNLVAALAMFAGARTSRAERSILLSAARSALFNRVVAARVADGSWNRPLEGDVFQLDGSGSIFGPVPLDDTLRERCRDLDIHPTGPLWGRGGLRSGGAVAALESGIACAEPALVRGLEAAGLEQERRSLRLAVRRIERTFSGDSLTLAFELPAGGYATTMLRELVTAGDDAAAARI
ncbi:MAG TPA: tRNA pseudouridine(13) synthase TruD [Candidatus Saccharimonadia bacterium]|nr:tRNA pseudouridine(13) synthase TruD [Candidatus Saccharimonadia bacterium]